MGGGAVAQHLGSGAGVGTAGTTATADTPSPPRLFLLRPQPASDRITSQAASGPPPSSLVATSTAKRPAPPSYEAASLLSAPGEGAFELGPGITEISGEAGSGKTQLCLGLCVSCASAPCAPPGGPLRSRLRVANAPPPSPSGESLRRAKEERGSLGAGGKSIVGRPRASHNVRINTAIDRTSGPSTSRWGRDAPPPRSATASGRWPRSG